MFLFNCVFHDEIKNLLAKISAIKRTKTQHYKHKQIQTNIFIYILLQSLVQ